jgi:hypothetical protein
MASGSGLTARVVLEVTKGGRLQKERTSAREAAGRPRLASHPDLLVPRGLTPKEPRKKAGTHAGGVGRGGSAPACFRLESARGYGQTQEHSQTTVSQAGTQPME